MKIIFKVQTCNGNPEIIKLINGIAKEIIAGEKKCLPLDRAKAICRELNSGKISL